MNYPQFGIEDFVKDQGFITWVKTPDERSDAFWQSFLKKYPNKKETIQAAKKIILAIDFDDSLPSLQQKDYILKNIHQHINQAQKAKIKSLSFQWKIIASTAACFLFIFASYFFYSSNKEILYVTAFGAMQNIILPDGSEVVLNANSSLKTKEHWYNSKEREVWLDGEAYFMVTKKPEKGAATFIVHTDLLDVKVLGTKFNVNSRSIKTDVVLTEGRIEIDLKSISTNLKPSISMTPGEKTTLVKNNKKITKKRINTKIFTAWKDHRLVFDETPLSHLKEIIEQQYGCKVIIDDPDLLNYKLEGTIGNPNLNDLIKTLEAIFELNIKKTKEELYITK